MHELRVVGSVIEYDGVRRDLRHLAPAIFGAVVALERAYAEAGMRPPGLSVIVEGVDVTKQPSRWPATERFYRGPGYLEMVD